jgi:nucleoside-diphosphate-sugar epimerase
MIAVGVTATTALLDWARRRSVQKFLFASTGNVYTPSTDRLTENSHCSPSNMYAATKLSAEYICEQYTGFFSVIIARLFGIYGPGQKTMLIHDMIRRVSTGDSIQLAQGIGLWLTPLYIDDCVQGLERLLLDHSDLSGVYNFGGTETLSLKEIALEIGSAIGKEPRFEANDNIPRSLIGDCGKLFTALNWAPEVSFKEGIQRTTRFVAHAV